MNPPIATAFSANPAAALRTFQTLCEEALALTTRESRELANDASYNFTEFNQWRKRLLPQLESGLIYLRSQRQKHRPASHTGEIVQMFQTIQSLMMKFLQLDRENQQALLWRGLVPARHLPAAAAQQPHYVAGLYRQHARAGNSQPA